MSLTQRTQGQKDPMDPENQNLKDLKDPEGYPERIPRGPKKDQHTNLLQIDGSAPGLGLETINFIILQFRGEKTKRR
jgi:hypothetical protein